MVLTALVFTEVHNQWPARNGKPAGERWEILVVDQTQPSQHRLRQMYSYALTPDERTKWAGKLDSQRVEIGVHAIQNGMSNPILRGQLLRVEGEPA